MLKKRFVCSDCGKISSKWSGQCSGCLNWQTIYEENVEKSTKAAQGVALSISDLTIDQEELSRRKTGIEELDRVFGGGVVSGGATLIGGDPGIGKSTLMLQLCDSLSKEKRLSIYVSAEESLSQIKLRADRLGINNLSIKLVSSNNIEDIIATLDENKEVKILIIDSIQMMATSEIDSPPGSISQIKSSSNILVNYAKDKGIILFIVGHITKEGQIAGPKLLEHMVDTVLYFENDTQNNMRILRSIKNRFGPVNELGVFEMTEAGLKSIVNPSAFFMGTRSTSIGSSVFAAIEGARPLMIEVQSLLVPSNIPTPRRSVVGWEINRLATILAVLAMQSKINLSSYEVYLSIAGGFKISDPAIDLAVAAAIISAVTQKTFGENTIFFGEIGLSGEVKQSSFLDRRISESIKLSFTRIIANSSKPEVTCVGHVRDLIKLVV